MFSDFEDFGKVQICPHCKKEAPADAFICPHCNRNLLQEAKEESFDEFAETEKPPLLATLLNAAALALLFFLAAITLLEFDTILGRADLAKYALYALPVVAVLFLTVFAARGRRPRPKLLTYLLSFVIVLIPVLGWLYGLFFAGRALATRRRARALLYLMLLLVGVAAFFSYGGMERVQDSLALIQKPKATKTQTVQTTKSAGDAGTVTPKATTKPSHTPTSAGDATAPEPTRTDPPTRTATAEPSVGDCMHWSEVTMEHLDQKLCVYGEYIEYYQKDDKTWVMVFSDEPGTFQIWSTPKNIEAYLPADGSKCVMVTGWIKTSGVRPLIILRIFDVLEVCPRE